MLTFLSNVNLCSNLHKTHKFKLLDNLIEANKNMAPQGSPEWLAIRVYNIGGSEMSVITGDNCYSSITQLVAQKVGFSEFYGNIATRWGKLFEPVTHILSEILFDATIKETGSLQGAVPNQRYSPDGLAVMKLKCQDFIDGENIETEEYCIVLFEFKSPLYTIPGGYIPTHYTPQVKTGLCSIPITDFAVFINNMFRKCKFSSLGCAEYDYNFHNKDVEKDFVCEKPLAFGVILFRMSDDQRCEFYKKYKNFINNVSEFLSNDFDVDDSDNDSDNGADDADTHVSNIYNILYSESKDFGELNYSDFNVILKLYEDKLLSVEYLNPHITEEYNRNDFIKSQGIKKGNNDYEPSINIYKKAIETKPAGYLPWNLFKSDIIVEYRDENYVLNQADKIKNTIEIINGINAHQNIRDKAMAFKKQFPRSKVADSFMQDISDFIIDI